MAGKLEEALLSIRVAWDVSTPAKEIVDKVRAQDLSLIQSLEGKCKDQVLVLAFKLAQNLKIPAVVALLLSGKTSILNQVLKKENSTINAPINKLEGGVSLIGKKVDTMVNVFYKQGEPVTNLLVRKEDGINNFPEGTIVDLVLGMALAHSNACILNRLGTKCKSYVKEESGDFWQGESSSLYKTSLGHVDGVLGHDMTFKRMEDWDSGTSDNSQLKDFSKWDENFQSLKPRLDSGEWEEVITKSHKKTFPTPVVLAKDVVDNKLRKVLSGEEKVEKSNIANSPDNVTLPAGHDGVYNCEIARKLLECLLLFSPRLTGHTQSPHLPPLLRAAKESDEALVCLLLDHMASNKLKIFVNEKDADGNTALHWALRQATPVNRRTVNSQVVRRLLKVGANVMTGNNLGATPVHTAAGHGHFEALSHILEKDSSGVNVLALTKETPLHYAVKNNHIACSFLLLKHGANRNVASSRNQKPIQLAPSVEMKYLLLQDDKILKKNTWETFKPILMNDTSSSSLHSLSMQSQTQFSSIADAIGFHQTTQVGSSMDWLSAQTLAVNSRDFNLGGDFDMIGGKDAVNLPQYKTVMCRFFASSEGCRWGTNCHFAHSEEELVGAEMIDGQLMGAGGSLSDDGSDQSFKNFKTKLCTHHEKTGKCPHGAKCTFAHGMIELRGALSSAAICIRPPVGIDTQPSSANSVGSSIGSEKSDDYISSRKVFVGGLPHYIQSDDLREFFEAEFGKVVDAVVICGVDVDGKVHSRGFGFVVFHDPRHANIACRRHYLPFQGKKVEVKRATARVDYGDDPIKFNPLTFPSGASSPIPVSPIISRPKEQMLSVPSTVPQQAWSLPPLAVDTLQFPSQESTHPSPSNCTSLSERASSLGSEMNNNHLMPQYSAPSLSHLSLHHNGSSPLQNNFGPLFSQSTSFSLDSGLDRSSFLLDSRPSQSFFSSTPGPSLYPHGSDHAAPGVDDEEFSELLANVL